MNLVLVAAVAAVSTAPVRDPFWPVGYEGERRVISTEPRFAPKPPAEEAAPAVREPTAPKADPDEERARLEALQAKALQARWEAALKSLRFGGTVQLQPEGSETPVSAVLINGRSYAEGDLVATELDGFRFIWRIVKSGAERTLKLGRVKAVELGKTKKGK